MPKKVLITGVAGFIGSHLLSRALKEGYTVIGVDNFLTGRMSNIEAVLAEDSEYSSRFQLIREDIRHLDVMKDLSRGCDFILHEAAIGSVPWSIKDPMLTHETNLTGFLNILESARLNGIRRVIYASSSAVYGDSEGFPAREGGEGSCISPYASSKSAQEIYAQAYSRCYHLEIVGLRYFNVFGPRQDPNGAYAAVIPKWGAMMARSERCPIFGDGQATRDYCHVSNVVEANFLAAGLKESAEGFDYAMNIGCGQETSLTDLYEIMKSCFKSYRNVDIPDPDFVQPRQGDIVRSVADISRARQILGFKPDTSVSEGIRDLIMGGEFG